MGKWLRVLPSLRVPKFDFQHMSSISQPPITPALNHPMSSLACADTHTCGIHSHIQTQTHKGSPAQIQS